MATATLSVHYLICDVCTRAYRDDGTYDEHRATHFDQTLVRSGLMNVTLHQDIHGCETARCANCRATYVYDPTEEFCPGVESWLALHVRACPAYAANRRKGRDGC